APLYLPTAAPPPPAACATAVLMPPSCTPFCDCEPACCVLACEPSCTQPGNQLSVRGEYLFWALKAAPTPPLLTTSSDPNDFATLGGRTTVAQFGGRDTQYGPLSGGRLIADYQLTDFFGMQVNGFLLEQRT